MASLRLSVIENQTNPDAEWVNRLLDAVEVRSAMPGRIRFHLGFEADEVLADTIRREIQKLESAKLDSYSVRTKNALITFDPTKTNEVDVTTALLKGVKEFARLHGECDLEHHHHETARDREKQAHAHDHDHGDGDPHEHDHKGHGEDDDCDHDHSATSTDAGIRKELLKLLATGGLLGYFAYKKIKGKPIAFDGNPLLDVASLVTIASGYSIFRQGVNSVQKHGKATDDTLIGIAVLSTLLMGESLTGLSVVWLINLGRLLEAITLKRSRTAIKELMDIAPKEAWLVTSAGGEKEKVKRISVEELEKSQKIRIFQGEKVPLDGQIISGQALMKEAFITGESIPREKTVGERVYAGSLVEQGQLDIEITNLVHDTVVAHMIDAIENVRDKKAPIEKIGNRFASKFVPVSLGVAAVTLLVTGDLRRAITMLVIACPCAAGLATPTAVSASIGQAARKGILIKGGTHIETAAHVDTVIFDKTGTLTMGEPTLDHFVSISDRFSEKQCLQIAASAEQHTTHPLGLALVKEAKKKKLELTPVKTHKAHPGMGISAKLEDKQVHIGNRAFMEATKIKIESSVESKVAKKSATGESLLYFAVNHELQGIFIVHDTLRPEAHEMLARLKRLGVQRVLLASGDRKSAAEYIAKQIGIHEVYSELLPADKLDLVIKLRSEGARVAMVGDGINDAQALAESDLSIAMGGGHCDIAIETADVTLARNDLLLVPETLDISQKTLKTIYQNFVAAVGINSGGLVVSTFGKLSPLSAALVHNASTIVVVLNSLRLGKQVAGSNPLYVLKEVKI
jgi:heavy metal translocating P-type ATPase